MNKWLKLLLFTDGALVLSFGLLGPIYAIFVEEIGGDILDASGAWAIFTLVTGLLILVLSKWEDHVQHLEKLLISSYLIRVVGFIGYIFVSTKYHLFAIQALLGIGMALSAPAYDSLYSRLLDEGKFASEWGNWESMNYIVTAIAAMIGGIIATYFGFTVLFIGMAGLATISLVCSLKFLSKEFREAVKE